MPGDSGVLVVTRVRSTTTKCTRGRGCSGHPAFPTPSVSRAERFWQSPGRVAPRDAQACLLHGSCVYNWVTSLRGALATKQSCFLFRGDDGLLRRKGLLAMTVCQPLDASWPE